MKANETTNVGKRRLMIAARYIVSFRATGHPNDSAVLHQRDHALAGDTLEAFCRLEDRRSRVRYRVPW